MDVIWITDGNKYFALYVNSDFFFLMNDHIEGYVEKDPEGSLRKRGINHKQCLLKKEGSCAMHGKHLSYHPCDSGNRLSQKNGELIFNFIKRKEKMSIILAPIVGDMLSFTYSSYGYKCLHFTVKKTKAQRCQPTPSKSPSQ